MNKRFAHLARSKREVKGLDSVLASALALLAC
jgi:hypothetical protein